MAAIDAFERFIASLADDKKAMLDGLIKQQRDELFAARSEDARLRIVQEFIEEVRERLADHKSRTTVKV
ncbi:MAG: hypothetical protein C4326_03350 [Ignavibacteria bacterium]